MSQEAADDCTVPLACPRCGQVLSRIPQIVELDELPDPSAIGDIIQAYADGQLEIVRQLVRDHYAECHPGATVDSTP